ncbi:MAG: AmmeMemoRadiSam system protein B [Planctomycetes bacterium]|nr:AmmeMemoRadiSam system protein B [Planctomycetota bacterium]
MPDDALLPRLRYVDAFPTDTEGEPRICLRDPLGFTDKVLLVPHPLFFILAHMDGKHTFREAQVAFARKYGQIFPSDRIEEIVRMLDESLFLDTDRFREHFRGLVDAFRAAPVREAIHAGGAYEAKPDSLRAMFDAFFEHPDGPSAEGAGGRRRLRGIVAPHVDPRRGGPCYAHAYLEVKRLRRADTYVVLGTSHAPMERLFALTRKSYDTPFGPAEVDEEIVDALEKRLGAGVYHDEFNHRGEHSIEFQAVFLRYLFEGKRSPKIVPILCGSLHRSIESGARPDDNAEFADLTAALRDVVRGRNVCLVAAADLAHVGRKFGDADAPTPESLAALEAMDVEMMRCLESLDADGFFRSVHGDQDARRICGFSPILAMMATLDAREGKLLRYSQVLEPDTGSAVTYASMAFYG